jgi:hypothetical protein
VVASIVVAAIAVTACALVAIAYMVGWLPVRSALTSPASFASPAQQAAGTAEGVALMPGETLVAPAGPLPNAPAQSTPSAPAHAAGAPGPVTPAYARHDRPAPAPLPSPRNSSTGSR